MVGKRIKIPRIGRKIKLPRSGKRLKFGKKRDEVMYNYQLYSVKNTKIWGG